MIKAKGLTKMFGPHTAVDSVSFEVAAGEVLGFLGPNGAGKSTTMRMLTGYFSPTAGKVCICGADMEDEPAKAKSYIGYLPENAPLYSDMTVKSFLEFTAGIRGLSGADRKTAVDKAVSMCRLGNVLNQSIDTLSKGYRHRTCFAQAVLGDPEVLVLDEPTDGLDPNQKHQMRQLISEMGKNKAIIVSTHILEEVEAICTRVIIIDRGKIVFNGTPAELRAKSPESGAVFVRCGIPLDALREAVSGMEGIADVKEDGEGILFMPADRIDGEHALSSVRNAFDSRGWSFSEIYVEKGRMDRVFRMITANDGAEA